MTGAKPNLWYRMLSRLAGETFRQIEADAGRVQKVETKLREAFGITIDEDEHEWRKLTGETRRDLPALTQERMQELAFYLWQTNLLGNRVIELPLAYILAEGVRLVAGDPTGTVQEWIDRFWGDPINQMDVKLIKKARELSIYGEQVYPAFRNEMSGHVRLGYLDPRLIQHVVTDPDNAEQPIGIVTKRNRKGEARKYSVIVNGAEDDLFTARTQRIRRQDFPDGPAFFFSVNDVSNGTRGRSDMLGQIDWLDGYDQYLFGEMDRTKFLRAFIWDVTLKGATKDEVEARAKQIAPPAPASVRVHNDSEIWSGEAPDLKAVDLSESARLFRNHVLGGGTIPEHWFGGGGDVNRAAAAEMGSPTFKMFTMRQTFLGYMLRTLGQYVIRSRELAHTGREPDLTEDIYGLTVQFPEMVPSDTTKYAAALSQVTVGVGFAIDRGLLTEETGLRMIENIAARLGVEFDAVEELKKAREEAARRREEDVFQDPPEDGDGEGEGEGEGERGAGGGDDGAAGGGDGA